MAIEQGSMFDCPECDTIAPSTSVPYDTLGYAMCPTCGYTSGPDDGRDD